MKILKNIEKAEQNSQTCICNIAAYAVGLKEVFFLNILIILFTLLVYVQLSVDVWYISFAAFRNCASITAVFSLKNILKTFSLP